MTEKELGKKMAYPDVAVSPSGLTKREAFAMAIMQGMAAKSGRNCTAEGNVRDAVELADALLAELEKEQP